MGYEMGFLRRLLKGGESGDEGPPVFDPRLGWPADDRQLLDVKVNAVVFPAAGSVDVVGEGEHQERLALAAGSGAGSGGRRPAYHAFLLPQPARPDGDDAVRVVLTFDRGHQMGLVGYLSREDAIAYRPVIDRLAAVGRVAAARAELIGGPGGPDGEAGDPGSFGIRLSLGSPAACMAAVDRHPPA